MFFGASPLSSTWMEPYCDPTKTAVQHEEYLTECTTKIDSLITSFFNAVDRGDLQLMKMLYTKLRIDLDALWNRRGMSALQVACERGYKNVVNWLIDIIKVDLNASDAEGLRAIHYAVERY